MRMEWCKALVVGALMMGCSVEAVDDENGGSADVGDEVDAVDGGDVDSGDGGCREPSGDVEQDGDEDDVEEAEEGWEPGDPAQGTGPFWPGTGRQGFESLVQGDDVRWERGVQGGHHIWIAAEVEGSYFEGLDEEERRQIRHTYRFIHEDGELLAQAARTGGFRFNEEAGEWRALGLYAVLEAPRRPSTMDGDLIRYVLDVEMEDGELFQRELWLVSQCCD